MEVYIIAIYDYLCVQTENCGFIINGVVVNLSKMRKMQTISSHVSARAN